MKTKIRDIVWEPEAQLGGQGSLLEGEDRLRPGCWAFALDPSQGQSPPMSYNSTSALLSLY